MGWEGKSQISDVSSAQTSAWVDLELVKNAEGMVMWKEFILWTNAGASSHYPVKRLLFSPGRSCLRGGEGNGASTVKSALDPSPRFQWYLNRDVCASCGSSDTHSVGKPAHKCHERTFQRWKIHQQSLYSIHLHSRHFLLQILISLYSWKEKGHFSPASLLFQNAVSHAFFTLSESVDFIHNGSFCQTVLAVGTTLQNSNCSQHYHQAPQWLYSKENHFSLSAPLESTAFLGVSLVLKRCVWSPATNIPVSNKNSFAAPANKTFTVVRGSLVINSLGNRAWACSIHLYFKHPSPPNARFL